jgi:hypothetical protein
MAAGASCPNANASDVALRGALMTDTTINFGIPGNSYRLTLRIHGVVEANDYSGGTKRSSDGASPRLNGWRMGGVPRPDSKQSVFMMRVTDPGSKTPTDYFLNSLVPPGETDRQTTYGVDYFVQLEIQGGATVRLIASDPDCSISNNCGPTPNDGNSCGGPIVPGNSHLATKAKEKNPDFDFNAPYNGQWLAVSVVAADTRGPAPDEL